MYLFKINDYQDSRGCNHEPSLPAFHGLGQNVCIDRDGLFKRWKKHWTRNVETFSSKFSKISYLQKWVFWVLVTLFSHVALHFVKRNTFNFYYIIFSKNYLCIHFKNSLQNSHVPDRVILWQIHFAKWKFLKMPQTAIICQLVANSGCVVWGHINTCNCTCNFVYSKLVNCNQDLICPERTFAFLAASAECTTCFGLSGWEIFVAPIHMAIITKS